MNHLEVKILMNGVYALDSFLQQHPIHCTHLNHGINKNINRLKKAVKIIDESVSKRLIEIEAKIIEEAKRKQSLFTEEEKLSNSKNALDLGYDVLTEDEKEEYKKLRSEYTAFMKEPSDFVPYYLNPEKYEDIITDIPYDLSEVLSNLTPE